MNSNNSVVTTGQFIDKSQIAKPGIRFRLGMSTLRRGQARNGNNAAPGRSGYLVLTAFIAERSGPALTTPGGQPSWNFLKFSMNSEANWIYLSW